jgi:hypothetical protein
MEVSGQPYAPATLPRGDEPLVRIRSEVGYNKYEARIASAVLQYVHAYFKLKNSNASSFSINNT